MSVTLQSLLAPQTLDSIRAKVIGKLQGRGLPTTDWSATGYERTIVEMVALALQDLVVGGLPTIVGGGFVDYALGDWLTLSSSERYGNTRNAATYTLGQILLTNVTASPISITANQLWFLFPSGNRYNGPIGDGPWTLPASGTLSIPVQSESPNHSIKLNSSDPLPLVNYVDFSNVSIVMMTPIAGVTATNPAPTYSSVIQTGVGSGTVTPSGTPSASHNVTIRIDVSGQVGGTLSYSYSIDGLDYVTGQTAATQTAMGGYSGLNVTLADGAGTPSFVNGTVYGYSCPGSWITTQGTDAEYDPALQARDRNRWPSLATQQAIPGSPTLGFYDLLVRLASQQVTQTLVQTDGTINNKVNIYVAGQGGLLPNSVLTAVQTFLAAFNMITDFPVALQPTALPITLGGLTITVTQAALVTAQETLQAALQTYFTGLGINASTTNGVIRHARIVQIIEDTIGVVDLTDTTMTINGAATSLTLPTVSNEVQLPTWGQQIASIATWKTV